MQFSGSVQKGFRTFILDQLWLTTSEPYMVYFGITPFLFQTISVLTNFQTQYF